MQKEGHEMVHVLKKIILVLAMLAIPAGPVFARADSAAKARAEAKKHFDRAMELNDDGQVAEAVIEFKRAYEIAPHHTVLYNLGQAYITLAKPVEAVAALQRYLDEGGKAIKPSRRAEVEQEIVRQKTRIATLEIRGLPDSSRVRVNGVDVGKAPLGEPILVGIGDHVVSATAEGYDPAEVRVTVAGEDRRTIELTMNCAHGTHNDGRGTCVAVGCTPGYRLVGGQCARESGSSGANEAALLRHGTLGSVSAGQYHACGVNAKGAVVCWGRNNYGQATPPTGAFASVSAGDWHTCGLKIDGTIVCWGHNDYGEATPRAGTFVSVSAGHRHTCAVRNDGTIACWGENSSGQASPPAGAFTSVSAGEHHSCGVRTDGTIICWGRNFSNESRPPAGTFAAVSAGQHHTCAVRADGGLVCWGVTTTPSAGIFASVSAGERHTCAVGTDGSLVCWGINEYGQATPPAGRFVSASAGKAHTCGVRTDGTIVCWGDNTYGQSTPPAM
jgi:alpha-tubulin suppressor-like RCC1 family protein